MKCPHDGTEMEHVSRHGVSFRACPGCGGVWLEAAEVAQLAAAVPSPTVTPDQPAAKRFEDRAAGEGAGRGVRYGGAHSKVQPDVPKSLIEDIFTPKRD